MRMQKVRREQSDQSRASSPVSSSLLYAGEKASAGASGKAKPSIKSISNGHEVSEKSARGKRGRGKIVCGDALDVMSRLKVSEKFDVVIADPPYNIEKDFGNNSDSMRLNDYVDWCKEWSRHCLRLVKNDGLVYIYGYSEILAHVATQFPVEKQKWLVWHYTNKTVPSSRFWQRSHETILCLWKGRRPKINVDAIREPYTESYLKIAGKPRKETRCRYNGNGTRSIKTNYMAHPGGALPRDVLKHSALAGGAGSVERWFLCRTCDGVFAPSELSEHLECDVLKHPTQKPSALTARLLLSTCDFGGEDNPSVLIPFAGSGSECVVAKEMGVNYYAIEINPEYVQLIKGWLKNV